MSRAAAPPDRGAVRPEPFVDPRPPLPDAPAFTVDDLIDFHYRLQDDAYDRGVPHQAVGDAASATMPAWLPRSSRPPPRPSCGSRRARDHGGDDRDGHRALTARDAGRPGHRRLTEETTPITGRSSDPAGVQTRVGRPAGEAGTTPGRRARPAARSRAVGYGSHPDPPRRTCSTSVPRNCCHPARRAGRRRAQTAPGAQSLDRAGSARVPQGPGRGEEDDPPGPGRERAHHGGRCARETGRAALRAGGRLGRRRPDLARGGWIGSRPPTMRPNRPHARPRARGDPPRSARGSSGRSEWPSLRPPDRRRRPPHRVATERGGPPAAQPEAGPAEPEPGPALDPATPG